MQQIINFLIRNKTFLLFLLLFLISFFLTIQSHSYHRSKFINSANFLTGGVYGTFNKIGQYFDLKEENQRLLEENNRLKSILFNEEDQESIDTTLNKRFQLISANVYKNSYSATNNYLTINKGKNDSIKEDLGVITSKGIVGIIDNTSNNYARVMSVLNTNSRINAKLKNSDHFGVLSWDGVSAQNVQLKDIQKQANITVGDTIVTSGNSIIFPKGIGIGKVLSFALDDTENYYTINVELFNDMTNVGHVHIITDLDKEEIESLEVENE